MITDRCWSWCVLFALCARSAAATALEPANTRAGHAHTPPAMRVSLDFGANSLFSAAVTTAAIGEASSIWRPYGVVVEAGGWSEPCRSDATIRVRLSVVSAIRSVDQASNQNALAGVRFDREGHPVPRIEIYVAALQLMMDTVVWLGLPPDRWPSSWWEEIRGRVLGRVLAHEIGHYLLRLQGHDGRGLMRAVHQMKDFTDPSREPFRLSRRDISRLVSITQPLVDPSQVCLPVVTNQSRRGASSSTLRP